MTQLLFECATLEMWPDILHIVVDSVGPDIAPQRDASPWMALYIIAWILLSNFFLLQVCTRIHRAEIRARLMATLWLSARFGVLLLF